MTAWVQIDGSAGEGGGQILRTALGLSLITGRPIAVRGIRAGRPKPGLQPQHLAAVRMAAMVAPGSRLEGAELDSQELRFEPATVRPGRFHIEVGTAGSTGLVLQTVALPLALAGGRSHLRIGGGTHVPWSPGFEFLKWGWIPAMAAIGVNVELTLEKAGFYPRGGGQILANIDPVAGPLQPLQLGRRPVIQRLQAHSLQTSDLGSGKDRRQTEGFVSRLKRHRKLVGVLTELERREGRFEFAGSTGTAFLAVVESDMGHACFQQLGERNRRAESVGELAADELIAFLESGAGVDCHTADQILMALALASGPSEITTSELTGHLRSLMDVIRQFLDVAFEVNESKPPRIVVKPGNQPERPAT